MVVETAAGLDPTHRWTHDKHIYNRTTGPVGQRLYYTAAASDPPTPLSAPVNTSKKRSWAERERKQKKKEQSMQVMWLENSDGLVLHFLWLNS